jgi:hypothetical protein
MTDASPWWTPDIHADRRPRLVMRNRIKAAMRDWFASRDFVEVETAALQVSPGNEAHLSAFATEAIGPGRSPAALSISTHLRNSPARSCLPPARSASSVSAPSIATASAGRCTVRNSPCSNGIARASPTRSSSTIARG